MTRRTRTRTRKHKQRGGAHVFPDVITDDNIKKLVRDYINKFSPAEQTAHPIGKWDVSHVTNMNGLFARMYKFNSNINDWDVSNVVSMNEMFFYAKKFNKPLDKWKTGNVKDMSFMFSNAVIFNRNINDWDVSNVETMEGMFNDAKEFNQPLDKWKTGNVKNMEFMFDGAKKFDQPIGSWNMLNVEATTSMFKNAEEFNQPIGKWKFEKLEYTSTMFEKAYKFNQPIGAWNMSKVVFAINMFSYAIKFNQPIGNWNMSSLKYMNKMFYKAFAFDQDLNKWGDTLNLSEIMNAKDIFKYSEVELRNHFPSWYIHISHLLISNLLNVESPDIFNVGSGELVRTKNQRENPHYNPNTKSPPNFNISGKKINGNDTYIDLIELDDVNLLNQMNLNKNLIVFYVNNKYYALERDEVIKQMKEAQNIKYECPAVSSFVGVKLENPFFGFKSLGIPSRGLISFFELWHIIKSNGLFDNGQRAFELEKNGKTFLSTASHAVMFDVKPSHVSASHCQPSQDEEIYEIRIIKLNSISKNRTRKNTKSLPSISVTTSKKSSITSRRARSI